MRGIGWILLGWLALGAAPGVQAAERGMLLETAPSEALLVEGRRHLLSFRMAAAERTFRRLGARPDGAAAAAYHLAQAALLEALMTGGAFDVFEARADTLRRVLDALPASPWRDYLAAEAQLQQAMASAKGGAYVRAAWAARAAYLGFSRLVRAEPGFEEAYKGLGLLHTSLGSLPRAYRSLLGILGFRGSVAGGLSELARAARRSRYNREEATVYHALTRLILYRTEQESVGALRDLHRAYPESPLFAHLYGFMLLSTRDAAAAERVLRPAVARADDPGYVYVHYLDYYYADALFKLGRFAEAEPYYRRYLARHEGPALKAAATLGLAEALELQGRRDDALAFYRQVESARGFDGDAAAQRRARRRLAAPMTPRQRQLRLGQNALDGGRYDAAVRLLTGVYDAPGADVEERAEAAYRLGRVHHAAGRPADALRAYGQAVALGRGLEGGWAPWGQYYAGELYAARGDRAAARSAFERARAYRGPFDYEQALEQSVKAALERLEAER